MTKHPYGPSFWWTYVANFSLMVAVSLLFRYADFVMLLGGTERQLGVITGLGMVGAIAARCFQGVAIDRYGPRLVWIFSLGLVIVCLLGHIAIGSLQPPWIYILRILYTVGLAGAFSASITYVSLKAPPNRMAEMIGMLGSSGFVGMAVGPAIGDYLFAAVGQSAQAVVSMFLCSASVVAVSLVCAWSATRNGRKVATDRSLESGIARTETHVTKNPLWLIWHQVRAYHPGLTLLVAVAIGAGIGMPGTFLRTFAEQRGLAGLRHYFLAYAVVAFLVRVATRQLADRWGTRPTILLGLLCLAGSMLAYLPVSTTTLMIFPAALAGTAHALLFPAVMAEGSRTFPTRYRGLATNLVLMLFDSGMLIGQPVIGLTIEISRARGWDGYIVAFVGLATSMLLVAGIYVSGKKARQLHVVPQQPLPQPIASSAVDMSEIA